MKNTISSQSARNQYTSGNSISAEIIAAHMRHSRQIRSMAVHQMFHQIGATISRAINRMARIFTSDATRHNCGA